jgi:hypothetical protein
MHYYGVFDHHDRLAVLVRMNWDVSDSWEKATARITSRRMRGRVRSVWMWPSGS